jgi:hypothetical protein
MFLEKAIRELHKEREQLDRTIRSLEELEEAHVTAQPPPPKRRGRKSMNPEQRLEVSQRMRKYWEGRRQREAEQEES